MCIESVTSRLCKKRVTLVICFAQHELTGYVYSTVTSNYADFARIVL